ncbi:nicotinate phosphoribosyltransferase [Hortaea werneckii]|nr:nicotinate phosphoribosyltransferase [Hortaea werneckii]
MATTTTNGQPHPAGIFSLLDTDLYKLTMQNAVLKYFPQVPVAYKFTNRTPQFQLTRAAFNWLHAQIAALGNLRVTDEEIQWLEKSCRYLDEGYLQYLRDFRLRPEEQVICEFNAAGEERGDEVKGELHLSIQGLWVDTILYEIPLLALISEAYFKFVDTDWTHEGQRESAKEKGLQLLEAGCVFSEFGSRRRRDYTTHCMVMEGLIAAQHAAATHHPTWPGKLGGTSNVHMAMKYSLPAIGTVAHEWFMAIAAIHDDYSSANERALQYWTGTFGRGVLSIALTDTFGTPAFLRSFARPAPKSGTTDPNTTSPDPDHPTYADIFTGVRQDSGDPLRFIGTMADFYRTQGIEQKKTIVFSDSLNLARCIEYKHATESAGGLVPSFGIGTFFTNDFRRRGASSLSSSSGGSAGKEKGEKSPPLNIVIKLSEAAGRPAVKLSDDVGKNTGEDGLVRRIKKEVGYEDRRWEGGDEAHRWG